MRGISIEKQRGWLRNFALDLLANSCRHPEALGRTSHRHHHARGNYADPTDGKRKKLSQFTARYTPEEAASYAACVSYVVDTKRKRPTVVERLPELRLC